MRVSLLLYILNCNFKNYSSPLPPACWNGVWDNLLFLKNAGGWRTVFLSWKPHVLIFADRCCSKARGTSSVPLRVWHQALAISVLRAPVENLWLDVESRALEKIYLIFFSLFLALHAACGNQPEMEPKPLALEEHSLSHWTTREVPRYIWFWIVLLPFNLLSSWTVHWISPSFCLLMYKMGLIKPTT